jgi:hypothetical protein
MADKKEVKTEKKEKKQELQRFDIYGQMIEAKDLNEAIEIYNKK